MQNYSNHHQKIISKSQPKEDLPPYRPHSRRSSRSECATGMDTTLATWASRRSTWSTRRLGGLTSSSSACSATSRHRNCVIWSTISARIAESPCFSSNSKECARNAKHASRLRKLCVRTSHLATAPIKWLWATWCRRFWRQLRLAPAPFSDLSRNQII